MSVLLSKLTAIVAAVLVIALLVACDDEATTSASCAFVYGDGSAGNDSNLHRVEYPGGKVELKTGENASYVPCNSRNYIINDGTVVNANNEKVGDRHTLIKATTKTGVPIEISARALWTLNQSEAAMKNFYTVCFKYTCATTKDEAGKANFSTPGWNGMLAENFGPTMDSIAKIASINVDDSIWQNQNPQQYKALADSMSAAFADVMRGNLGFPNDLFCGSGNSTWKDPSKPGESEFTCSPVRIQVDYVQRGELRSDESTQGAVTVNAQRLKNAQALYGPDAGYWLALQDLIDKCKNAGTTCIINVGGASGPTVPVPAIQR